MPKIGPGPKYMLPSVMGYENHDYTKDRRPQYSFGTRFPLKDFGFGPGPKYDMTISCNKTRYGIIVRSGVLQTPAYTFGKVLPRAQNQTSPGPAAHTVISLDVSRKSAPKYGMAKLLNDHKKEKIPAPNAYTLDEPFKKISRKNPEYSMAFRTELKSGLFSPGPAKYPCCGSGIDKNITHLRSPKYTMGTRAVPPADKTRTPAPNHYSFGVPGKKSPIYSFGTRHSEEAPPMIVQCDN